MGIDPNIGNVPGKGNGGGIDLRRAAVARRFGKDGLNIKFVHADGTVTDRYGRKIEDDDTL